MGSNKRKKEASEDADEELAGPSSFKRRKLEEEESKQLSESAAVTPPTTSSSTTVNVPSTSDDSQDEMDTLQLLVSAFSNAQQDQYEIFRRSTFPKAAVKKIMQTVAGTSVPQNAVIAMAGITKVYVGEIVEEACVAREGRGEEGPLQPKHIREAVRRLKNSNKVPNSRYKRVFPFR